MDSHVSSPYVLHLRHAVTASVCLLPSTVQQMTADSMTKLMPTVEPAGPATGHQHEASANDN